MKILVVGTSSFSGKHFCDYAEREGAAVVRATLRDFDWTPPPDITHCVNFAALNVVAPSWDWPINYVHVNVSKQIQLWEKLADIKLIKYVHVSTPEVYGNVQGTITESQPFRPSTPYAVSRAACEEMARCYFNRYGFPVVVTRSCNVYGPGQQLYRLIPKLIVSIKKGIKFPLEGSGKSRRAFMHVHDMCAATWQVLLHGTPYDAYHISTETLLPIRDLVAKVCSMMWANYTAVVEAAPERPGKDDEYVLDTRKIRALGWKPEISLPLGIEAMIEWVNANWSHLKHQPMEYHIEL